MARIQLVDDLGFRVEVETPPARIVSLVPSWTETLFALGLGRRGVCAQDRPGGRMRSRGGCDGARDYPLGERSRGRPWSMVETQAAGLLPDLEEALDGLQRGHLRARRASDDGIQ